MKKVTVFTYYALAFLIVNVHYTFAQLTACPNGLMYSQTSPIQAFNPALPQGPGNPVSIGVTGSGSGLAYGPNINGGTPNPTFYTIIGGNYAWYNGTGWTNTGHPTGGAGAVNIGIGPGCLYNLVGSPGDIYVYNGTGPGTYLCTAPGFLGGGPYDICVDNCCNFYLICPFCSPQWMRKYSPSCVQLAECTMSGIPASQSGIGFAIVGNSVIISNGGGLFIGNMTGNNITFTNVPNVPGGGDVASCPVACSTCGAILPISYKSFSCENAGIINKIYLETSLEEYVESYIVERSTDAENFKIIGTIKANNFPSKYVYEDREPAQNVINYYRVTALERTGLTESSEVCHCSQVSKQIGVSSIYPNPATNKFYMQIDSRSDTEIKVIVMDATGRIVKENKVKTNIGLNKYEGSFDGISSGFYFIQVISARGEQVYQQKITKLE